MLGGGTAAGCYLCGGGHLQNLSVLRAQRRSSRSSAVTPVTLRL